MSRLNYGCNASHSNSDLNYSGLPLLQVEGLVEVVAAVDIDGMVVAADIDEMVVAADTDEVAGVSMCAVFASCAD